MVVILQFSLCMHELERLMINLDDCLLSENVCCSTRNQLRRKSYYLQNSIFLLTHESSSLASH
jgi:hypothetical protein